MIVACINQKVCIMNANMPCMHPSFNTHSSQCCKQDADKDLGTIPAYNHLQGIGTAALASRVNLLLVVLLFNTVSFLCESKTKFE